MSETTIEIISETVVEVNEDVITIEIGNAISGLAIPAGSTTQVQYNNAGAMGGTGDITIGASGPIVKKIILSPTLNYLTIYASDGLTQLFVLDSSGNLFIKGSIGQL